MSYDPISWLDRRVSKTESDLSALQRWRESLTFWGKAGCVLGFVLLNVKRETAIDLITQLASALK